MHYYNFNIADYRKDTLHLTPIEHYIYRELIDWYYLDEEPIPLDIHRVIRRLRLSESHITELESVLKDFFDEHEDGYRQSRIDAEIQRFKEKSEKARASVNKRWHNERNTNVIRTYNEGNTNQEPITNNQELKEKDIVKTPHKKIPFKQIVDAYHEHLPMLPHVNKLTETRKRYIKNLWTDGDIDNLEDWESYFRMVGRSKFLTGNNDRSWKPNLEWITKPENFNNIVEGKYHA